MGGEDLEHDDLAEATADLSAQAARLRELSDRVSAADPNELDGLAAALTDTAGAVDRLAEAAAPFGYCRRAWPPKPLRMVMDNDGTRYCCSHETTHCEKARS